MNTTKFKLIEKLKPLNLKKIENNDSIDNYNKPINKSQYLSSKIFKKKYEYKLNNSSNKNLNKKNIHIHFSKGLIIKLKNKGKKYNKKLNINNFIKCTRNVKRYNRINELVFNFKKSWTNILTLVNFWKKFNKFKKFTFFMKINTFKKIFLVYTWEINIKRFLIKKKIKKLNLFNILHLKKFFIQLKKRYSKIILNKKLIFLCKNLTKNKIKEGLNIGIFNKFKKIIWIQRFTIYFNISLKTEMYYISLQFDRFILDNQENLHFNKLKDRKNLKEHINIEHNNILNKLKKIDDTKYLNFPLLDNLKNLNFDEFILKLSTQNKKKNSAYENVYEKNYLKYKNTYDNIIKYSHFLNLNLEFNVENINESNTLLIFTKDIKLLNLSSKVYSHKLNIKIKNSNKYLINLDFKIKTKIIRNLVYNKKLKYFKNKKKYFSELSEFIENNKKKINNKRVKLMINKGNQFTQDFNKINIFYGNCLKNFNNYYKEIKYDIDILPFNSLKLFYAFTLNNCPNNPKFNLKLSKKELIELFNNYKDSYWCKYNKYL